MRLKIFDNRPAAKPGPTFFARSLRGHKITKETNEKSWWSFHSQCANRDSSVQARRRMACSLSLQQVQWCVQAQISAMFQELAVRRKAVHFLGRLTSSWKETIWGTGLAWTWWEILDKIFWSLLLFSFSMIFRFDSEAKQPCPFRTGRHAVFLWIWHNVGRFWRPCHCALRWPERCRKKRN